MATSTIQLTDALKSIFRETAQQLKGSERRQFMAKVVKSLGLGGQTQAEKELGWNRGTIRKGMQELTSGIPIKDAFERRGRKRVESKLPNLLEDIRAIVDPHSQADPSLKSERLYTRISAAEVRRQLIEQKGYRDEELPTAEVIRQRLNEMNYRLRRVVKAKPQKKIPETDAIFEQVNQINQKADQDDKTLRISIDAKATVKVGEYDRGVKKSGHYIGSRP